MWKDFKLDNKIEIDALEGLSKVLNKDVQVILNEAIIDCNTKYTGERLTIKLTAEASKVLEGKVNKSQFVRNAITEYAKKNGVIIINE